MLLLMASLAHGVDFLPSADSNEEEPPSLNEAGTEPRIRQAPVTAASPLALGDEDLQHDWVDPAARTLAISGEWNRRYYVTCTATAGEHLVRWQQGPYDAPGMTEVATIDIPADAGLTAREAVVSCKVVSALFDDSAVRTYRLSPLWLDTTGATRSHVRSPNLTTEDTW